MKMTIEAIDLSKSYRIYKEKSSLKNIKNILLREFEEKMAIRSINFTIKQGESIAYIGPNGSGKSTTIKLLTGILTPSSGKVYVNGIEPYKKRKENAKSIGFVFGQRTQLWWDLPIRESFDIIKVIYRIPNDIYQKNLNRLIELLDLKNYWGVPVRQLSLGQRMRAEIACAFLHDPQIVYLDEPTIGIDLVTKEHIRNFLRQVNQEKKTTIILTSHDIDDIEIVCDRLILIDSGDIIHDGNKVDFMDTYITHKNMSITFAQDIPDEIDLTNVEIVRNEKLKNKINIRYEKTKLDTNELLIKLSEIGVIKDFTAEEDKLEDVLKTIYTEGI